MRESTDDKRSAAHHSGNRSGILAGGNFITDYVKVIEAWPEQDTLASIRTETMSNGGGPYNILKNLAAMAPELPIEACGLLGEDTNGDWILNDCRDAGIGVSQMHRTSQAHTSYTDAMTVASTGRRTFFHQCGSNALLSPEHFDFTHSKARIFMLGYLMLLDSLDAIDGNGVTAAAKVLRRAREAGMITAVDCVSQPGEAFRQVVTSALAEADLLFINEFEISQVLGREVEGDRRPMEEAALELASQASRDETQVIVHAVNGAVAARRDGVLAAHPSLALPETEIAGASGAGDAFAAGFLLGVHENLDSRNAYAMQRARRRCHCATPPLPPECLRSKTVWSLGSAVDSAIFDASVPPCRSSTSSKSCRPSSRAPPTRK